MTETSASSEASKQALKSSGTPTELRTPSQPNKQVKSHKPITILDLPTKLLQQIASYIEFPCWRTPFALASKKLLASVEDPFKGFKPCEKCHFVWGIRRLGVHKLGRREWDSDRRWLLCCFEQDLGNGSDLQNGWLICMGCFKLHPASRFSEQEQRKGSFMRRCRRTQHKGYV